MSICAYCNKEVQIGLYAIQLGCKHYVHSKCLDKKNPNFDICSERCGEKIVAEEPISINGRDYITNPPSASILNIFTVAKEPFNFFKEKKTIDYIKNQKGYHLQKLLSCNVTIDTFIQNDYNWDDLKEFKDFNDKERGKLALVALKTNAEHFRDCPHVLAPAIKDLGITGRNMCEMFGLYFAGDSLQVVGGSNKKAWRAADCVKVGMKMKDLYGAGMEYVEQYDNLLPTDQDIVKLGITDKDVLPSRIPPEPMVITIQQPSPVKQLIIPPVVSIAVKKKSTVHGLKKK